ncbi:hypothetical protein EJB05_20022, partial [Eragrostis curvula]
MQGVHALRAIGDAFFRAYEHLLKETFEACRLTWPADRLIVQVLDDSTDAIIKDLVKSECEKWAKEGINIKYETRKDRAGYKAGNLRDGMKHGYVQACEFVAIFDADFQPAPDFLVKTVPFLVHNPTLALVQARWKFVNANDCLLTRMQEITMDYHFKVEQEAGSSLCNFFGFNVQVHQQECQHLGGAEGREGVEEEELLECGEHKQLSSPEAGMIGLLALRASLLDWEFLYVGSIKVLLHGIEQHVRLIAVKTDPKLGVNSELPSTLKAYRSQQHRWSCGPALLFKKMFWEILAAKKVSAWKKFYIIYIFFISRRIVATFFFVFFFSVLLQLHILFPEVRIPAWHLTYIPIALALLSSVGTPRFNGSLHLIILWILFETVITLHRFKAMLIGFSEGGRANEWIVTQKLGNPAELQHGSRRALRSRASCTGYPTQVTLLIYICVDLQQGRLYKTKSRRKFHDDLLPVRMLTMAEPTHKQQIKLVY